MSTAAVLGVNALVIVAVMTATWLVSVVVKDASIVDIMWGPGFVAIAVATFFTADGHDTRQLLLLLLPGIWGLRLGVYLGWRNIGKGEDWRYKAMRKKAGASFVWRSYITVFLLQAGLAWVVSLPVQLGAPPDDRGALAVLAPLGVAIWAVGLFFEAVGDLQLARFKADPDNAGKVMDQGLWRYTRHPNYFGDACVWWGIWLVAASTAQGAIGVIGPVVMTFLLLRVSGVAMLERSLSKRKPEWQDYARRTSAFFPRPPRPE